MSSGCIGKNKYGLICLLLTTAVGTSVGHPGTVAAEPFVQQAKLSDLDGVVTRLADYQGISVSVDGNTAVVGASGDENNRGSAYVFKYDGAAWTETSRLIASDGEAYDGFGQSVFVSGRTIVVSSPRDRDNGRGSGSAYVFTYDGESWAETAKLIASDSGWFHAAGDFDAGRHVAGLEE